MTAPMMHPSMTQSVKQVEKFHQMILDKEMDTNPVLVWAAIPGVITAASKVWRFGERAHATPEHIKMAGQALNFIASHEIQVAQHLHTLILTDADPIR